MPLEILPEIQKKVWAKLAGVELLDNFYLAGGTALAVQLEHRESIDFDFFSANKFNPQKIIHSLSSTGELEINDQSEDTINASFDNVKLSFFHYPYPLIETVISYEGLKIADIKDIIPMKLIAISQRGSKKDFIDIYECFKAGWNLEAMFDAVDEKFKTVKYNKMLLIKSLTYFKDAESESMPIMRRKLDWELLKQEITSLVENYIS